MASGDELDGWRAKIVGDRYECPWKKWKRPNPGSLAKWRFWDTNNSNVPGKQELDKILPVFELEKDKVNKPPKDKIQVTWIGHATLLVQFDGITILTDPIFSDVCGPLNKGMTKQWSLFGYKRFRQPSCKIGDLPEVDAVIISHSHYDHLDKPSVESLRSRFKNLHWYVGMGLKEWFRKLDCENVHELNWWESETQSVRGEPQSVSGEPQPVSGGPQPFRGEPQPISGEAQPVSGESQPVSGEPQSFRGEPQPVSGDPQPISVEAQPVSGEPQPVSGDPQPICGEAHPVSGEAQPLSGEAQPVSGEAQPVSGEAQHIRGEPQPVRGEPQPVSGEAQSDCGEKKISFICTPSQHWCGRRPNDENKHLWCSWVLKGPTKSFFFAGDTGYYQPLFRKIGEMYGLFDLAALPIGAYEPRYITEYQHSSPEEAVQIHTDVKAEHSVAMHWGTFIMTNEFYLEPPRKVREEMMKAGLNPESFQCLYHGETWVVGEHRDEPSFMIDTLSNLAG